MDNKLTPQIAAMYWGCDALITLGNSQTTQPISGYHINLIEGNTDRRYQLILTPLSEISDEDAIEVAKIVGYQLGREQMINMGYQTAIMLLSEHIGNVNPKMFIQILTFLRLKGYDMDSLIGTVAIKKEVSNG